MYYLQPRNIDTIKQGPVLPIKATRTLTISMYYLQGNQLKCSQKKVQSKKTIYKKIQEKDKLQYTNEGDQVSYRKTSETNSKL